jgi:hypothetical protein
MNGQLRLFDEHGDRPRAGERHELRRDIDPGAARLLAALVRRGLGEQYLAPAARLAAALEEMASELDVSPGGAE